MEPGVIVGLLLAVLVGISLGLLGGGGSILAVPILTYVVGLEPREAIAASLFIVGVTSVVGLTSHARAGRVRWKTGIVFGLAAMAGAFLGGIIGGYVPGAVLMVLFSAMMIATATAMIRGSKKPADGGAEENNPLPLLRVLLDGSIVGIATGLVGAGGGFLIVPALNLLGGLPMAVAVGTSLLVMSMKSFAGLGGYLFSVHLQWPIVLGFTVIAVVGSFIGSFLAGRISGARLRKGFGLFVLLMGAIVLVQEAPQVFSLITGG